MHEQEKETLAKENYNIFPNSAPVKNAAQLNNTETSAKLSE